MRGKCNGGISKEKGKEAEQERKKREVSSRPSKGRSIVK
jgi:hypothetical protein